MTSSNSCLSEFIVYSCISNKRKWFIRNPRDSISVCLSEFWPINSNCALRYCFLWFMVLNLVSGVMELAKMADIMDNEKTGLET